MNKPVKELEQKFNAAREAFDNATQVMCNIVVNEERGYHGFFPEVPLPASYAFTSRIGTLLYYLAGLGERGDELLAHAHLAAKREYNTQHDWDIAEMQDESFQELLETTEEVEADPVGYSEEFWDFRTP